MNQLSAPPKRCSQSKNSLTSGTGWFLAGGGGRAWLVRVLLILTFTLLFAAAGCEVLTYERTVFPEAFVGADGQGILRDDIRAIVIDANLDEDAKRQALRDLGIEDEDLLDAFLSTE